MPNATPAQSQWRGQWPAHCRSCGGWGGSHFTQGHGDGGPGEPMFEPCSAIADPLTCHRCGEPGLAEDGEGPCKHCGWNYDDGVPEQEPDWGS